MEKITSLRLAKNVPSNYVRARSHYDINERVGSGVGEM